jgi:hypothetical protein
VAAARIEAVCCDAARAILFVGIEEKGAAHAAFRSPPEGDAALPEELLRDYHAYLGAVARAARNGAAAEDLTAGHSQMADPHARALQDRFAAFAAEHIDQLRDVLSHAAEPEQRQIAAVVIGYAPRKAEVVNDLQVALQDPDEAVRANAVRSLTAFAVLAATHPETSIAIAPTWFVEMLNSIVLSDRVEAARALVTLTDGSNTAALDQIRERALAAVIEMAQWKTPRYALPPFLLAGRLAGIPDAQIHQYWTSGRRTPVIQRAIGSASRRPLK